MSSDSSKSENLRQFLPYQTTLMRKLRNAKKDTEALAFKNSIRMPNSSEKNPNKMKGKNKNKSSIQNKLQNGENFIDCLFDIRKNHSNININ